MTEKENLQVGGPYSPISLKKFIDQKGNELKELTLLVDGTGLGIAKDADCMYITVDACYEQANWYREKIFNGKAIPAYLYRYLTYMFIDNSKEYKSDAEVARDFHSGEIHEESPDYQIVLSLIQYCDTNREAAQVIGLIQLIAGTMNIAKKNNAGVRIYLEHPETHLHPKRCLRFMSLLQKMREEYGLIDGDDKTNKKP